MHLQTADERQRTRWLDHKAFAVKRLRRETGDAFDLCKGMEPGGGWHAAQSPGTASEGVSEVITNADREKQIAGPPYVNNPG